MALADGESATPLFARDRAALERYDSEVMALLESRAKQQSAAAVPAAESKLDEEGVAAPGRPFPSDIEARLRALGYLDSK